VRRGNSKKQRDWQITIREVSFCPRQKMVLLSLPPMFAGEIILNPFTCRVVYGLMTWLSKAMAVLLALLWVPLATHCDWEHLPGLESLACCDQAGTAPHQDNDCQTDVCASVESGDYKLEERTVSAPTPVLVAVAVVPLLASALENPSATVPAISSVPIELPQLWQFAFRTAAPPRAPSFVS
jgi:hypothetical protein